MAGFCMKCNTSLKWVNKGTKTTSSEFKEHILDQVKDGGEMELFAKKVNV